MRRCHRIGCENGLDHLRAGARYCSPTCKREAARSRDLSDGSASPGFWERYARLRRKRRCRPRETTILVTLALGFLTLAGCGGEKHTFRVSGHSCGAHDYAMPCALQQLPRPLTAVRPLTVTAFGYGVDFGWSCPVSSASSFGASYLSYDNSKDWTRSCINAFHAAGKSTVAVWEAGGQDTRGDYRSGYRQAKRAADELAQLGAPGGQPLPMAIDFDANGPELLAYFRGANAAEPGRINAYGGYRPILYLYERHLVGHFNWQTYAWSAGRWLPAQIAPLEQYLNSSSVDYDRAIAANYGQWPAAPRPRPRPTRLPCFGAHAQLSNATCKRVRADVASWTRAHGATRRAIANVERGLRSNRCRRKYRRDVCVDLGREIAPALARRERYFAGKIAGALREYG